MEAAIAEAVDSAAVADSAAADAAGVDPGRRVSAIIHTTQLVLARDQAITK
jgi:hypothetical protein